MAGKLFVVSACSGVGKTTLVTKVIDRIGHCYDISRLITYTSKAPRVNEIDGKDYHFISAQEFEIRIKEGFFLEWSCEYGNYYGSPSYLKKDLAGGKSYIVITNRAGAKELAKTIQDSVLIWIYAKDIEQIKKRLLIRNTENFEQIQKRLGIAKEELDAQQEDDIFNYIILNDAIDNAVQELESVIELNLKNR